MNDIFISYVQEDRDTAARVAAALESRGWGVWWDRHIPPGRTFDEMIEQALGAARCVIVLWSGRSVASRWVRAEASTAAERGTLVPVLIESVSPPLEFRRIQAANLVDWNGEADHAELQKLLETTAGFISQGPAASKIHIAPSRGPRAVGWSAVVRYGAPALVAFVVGIGATYLLMPSERGSFESPIEPSSSASAGQPGSSAFKPSSSASSGPPIRQATNVPVKGRLDLLAKKNGGHLLRAPSDDWNHPIDGHEHWDYLSYDEAVYGFKDNQSATFDTFRVLIMETRDWNIKTFELLTGDNPTGQFESIGQFETENVRIYPSPWQEFTFPARRARYLKVRVLSVHASPGGSTPQVVQWQLLGSF